MAKKPKRPRDPNQLGKLIVDIATGEAEENKIKQKDPWYSVKQTVHHNNTECNTGNNIERENLRQGTGGKPLCKECERLR